MLTGYCLVLYSRYCDKSAVHCRAILFIVSKHYVTVHISDNKNKLFLGVTVVVVIFVIIGEISGVSVRGASSGCMVF